MFLILILICKSYWRPWEISQMPRNRVVHWLSQYYRIYDVKTDYEKFGSRWKICWATIVCPSSRMIIKSFFFCFLFILDATISPFVIVGPIGRLDPAAPTYTVHTHSQNTTFPYAVQYPFIRTSRRALSRTEILKRVFLTGWEEKESVSRKGRLGCIFGCLDRGYQGQQLRRL